MPDYSRYQRFQRKQDNANQVISAAQDLTPLQGTLESVQRDVIGVKDSDFLQKALFTLDHNPLVNALWVDLMEDDAKVDIGQSRAVTFTKEERGWAFADSSTLTDALVTSRPYTVETRSAIKGVLLMVNALVPEGSTVTYEVTTDDRHWVPITPSADNVLNLQAYMGYTMRVRARIRRSDVSQRPILYGWALLYYDPKVGVVQLDTGDYIVPPMPDGNALVTIRHEQILEIGPDDHHPQQHKHDGLDGSGRIGHGVLTGVGPDDHHPKDHHHAHDGVAPVVLEHDVIGTLPIGNSSPVLLHGWPGSVKLTKDSARDLLIRVESPDSRTDMEYDAQDRLIRSVTVFTKPPANGMTAITTINYATEPPTFTNTVKDAQGADVVVLPVAEPVPGGAI